MHMNRHVRVVPILAALLASSMAFATGDDVDLQVAKSQLDDSVTLTWTGGHPAFEVRRGASPIATERVGDTAGRSWSDPASTELLVTYEIRPIELDLTLGVNTTGGSVVGGVLYPSSSELLVTWSPPASSFADSVNHCEIVATESLTGSSITAAVARDATSVVVAGLRSSTTYSVALRACLDPACSELMEPPSGSASGATPQETWQLQGSGSAIATLTRIVPDGNVKIHAFRYGDDAPAPVAGRVQIYYGPAPMNVKGLAVGSSAVAATSEISTVSSFTSVAGSSGLIRPPAPATLVADVATGQAVPLSAAAGGLVRLYFEAPGVDGKTRILYVNSRDGWTGRDFNAGASSVCSTTADYSTGGGCAPTVAVGVAGDLVAPNPGISNARQFKIGFPTLDDWRWILEPGTFMVFTTDLLTGCSASSHNQVYS